MEFPSQVVSKMYSILFSWFSHAWSLFNLERINFFTQFQLRSRSAARALRCRDSKRWAIGNYFPVRIWYKFLISICKGDRAWRLCSSWHLAQRMPPCSARISSKLWQTPLIKQIRPLHCGILCTRCQELRRPRSKSPLQSEIRNLYEIRTEK